MIHYSHFYKLEKLVHEHKQAEAKQLINSIHTSYYNLQEENAQLHIQIQELKEILFISRNLIFDGDAYWLISEGQKIGPFCPKCYHDNGSLIRLQMEKLDEFDMIYSHEHWTCSHCDTRISPEVQVEQLPKRAKILSFIQ